MTMPNVDSPVGSNTSDTDLLVLEGIVVTTNEDGTANVSPMGPIVDRELTRFTLRPFNTSNTYANLQRNRKCVFHVVDDVLLLARAAVGEWNELPPLQRTPNDTAWRLVHCHRWFELDVVHIDASQPRVDIACSVVDRGQSAPFFGWNRAKHAVLEAAILATRVHLLPASQIESELARLNVMVEKTAGRQEREAMEFLRQSIHRRLQS